MDFHRRRFAGYGRHEHRRDHRRAVRIAALLNARAVTITNISVAGARLSVPKTKRDGRPIRAGDRAWLTFPSASARAQSVEVEIRRVAANRDAVGVRFINLDDVRYRLVERLSIGRPV